MQIIYLVIMTPPWPLSCLGVYTSVWILWGCSYWFPLWEWCSYLYHWPYLWRYHWCFYSPYYTHGNNTCQICCKYGQRPIWRITSFNTVNTHPPTPLVMNNNNAWLYCDVGMYTSGVGIKSDYWQQMKFISIMHFW